MLVPALLVMAVASDWGYYGGDPGGTRFSRIDSIKSTNIVGLRKTWEYHTGALQPETANNHKAAFECTPILVDGTLYVTTPFNQIIALNPAKRVRKSGDTIRILIDEELFGSNVTRRGSLDGYEDFARDGVPDAIV